MMKKKGGLNKQSQSVWMDAAGIDRLSALLAEALTQAEADKMDVIRLRLAAEDILSLWRSKLEEDVECTFRCGASWGRMFIEIRVPGPRMDPGDMDEEEAGGMLYSRLIAQAGLALVYAYQDGVNRLTVYPSRRQRLGPLAQLVLSIVAAVACGLLARTLPQSVQSMIGEVITPIFTALMGVLQALAGPMIFLSVCWGIVSISDVETLGRIGRTVIARFMAAIFFISGITALCITWFFHGGNGTTAAGGDAAAQIYSMILGVVPGNFIAPFLEGNSLQIIFMAICAGLALLVLGEKVPTLCSFVEQVNITVQFMMEIVSRYISVFIFFSLFYMLLSNTLDGLGSVVKGVLLAVIACMVWPVLYALAVSLKLRVSYPMLIRKLLPTYLIALATASSAAALSTNLETCESRLGISNRISNFAVPLGQVVFKTGGAIGFFALALGLAENYHVAMSLPWIVTGVLVSGLLAIAAPPVPGGSLTCYTVLLMQLGIPAEAIALAVAGNMILDFFMTSCGISCLQSELTLAANRLGMLNREILEKE